MKIDLEKLKKTDIIVLRQEISKVDQELSDRCWEPSWARTKELLAYKEAINEEIKLRQEAN